mmetsp:Transcript_14770/g.36824  ORF Transcript_14770/g.36824 Transcript_14770/m.36824 type:complete len:631 (+) Transcript_14770:100-1992(+)
MFPPSQAEGREGSSPGPGRRRVVVVVMMKSTPSSVSSRELRKSSHLPFRTAGYSRISCCAPPARKTLRGAALALGPSLVCNGALLRESRNNECAGHAGVCIFDREHNNVAFASNHCEALTAESKIRVPLSRRSRSSRSLPAERSGTPSMAAYAEVFSHPQHLFLDAHDCAATPSSVQQSSSKLWSASDVSVDGVPVLSRCGSVLGKEGARWPASYHGSQHLDLAFYGCNAQHAAGSKLALLETGAKAQTSNRKSSGSRGGSGTASSSVTGTGTVRGKSDLPLTVSLLQTAEKGREEEDAAPTMVVFKAQGCKMFITFVGGVTSAVENLGNSTVRVKNCARTGHQMDQYGILVSGINCEAIDLKTPEQANVRTEGNFTLTQCQKTSVMQGPDDGTFGEPAATTAPGGGGAGAGAKGADETPALRPGAPDPALNPVTPPPVPAEEPAAGAAAGSALDMGGDEDEDEELLAARRKQAVEPNQAAAVPPSAEAPAVVPAAAAAPSQVEPTAGGAAAPPLAASAVQGGALAAAAAAPAKGTVSATSATAAAPPAATANREIAESELKKVVETAAAELLEKEKKVRAAVAATSGGAAAAEPMAETTPMSFLEVGESVTSATRIPATATSAHGDERK